MAVEVVHLKGVVHLKEVVPLKEVVRLKEARQLPRHSAAAGRRRRVTFDRSGGVQLVRALCQHHLPAALRQRQRAEDMPLLQKMATLA
jgi:hypothetical protein